MFCNEDNILLLKIQVFLKGFGFWFYYWFVKCVIKNVIWGYGIGCYSVDEVWSIVQGDIEVLFYFLGNLI